MECDKNPKTKNVDLCRRYVDLIKNFLYLVYVWITTIYREAIFVRI